MKKGLKKEEAEALKAKLAEAGAKVSADTRAATAPPQSLWCWLNAVSPAISSQLLALA